MRPLKNQLPKASFTPPVVGYIGSSGSAAAPARDATGEKRIYFDGKVSALFAEQNKNVPQEVLAEYAEDFEAEAVKLVTNENYVSSKNIQIEPVFRQINQNQVALPAGYRLMKEKTSAGGVLEKITSLPARLYEDESLLEKKEISKKAETPEEAILSEEEKQTVKLLIAEMNESERIELIYAAGEDWNNITPFLIREFLWRKKNGRSVKNLSEEIKVYEKLSELPQSELEKYLTSSAVNGNENKESPAPAITDHSEMSCFLLLNEIAFSKLNVSNNIPLYFFLLKGYVKGVC